MPNDDTPLVWTQTLDTAGALGNHGGLEAGAEKIRAAEGASICRRFWTLVSRHL